MNRRGRKVKIYLCALRGKIIFNCVTHIKDIFGNNQQISRKDRKERKAEENCRTDNISLYSFASSAPFAGTFFLFPKMSKV